MANVPHDRADLAALAPDTARDSGLLLEPWAAAHTSVPAVLSVHFAAAESSFASAISPALSLAADLIQASGGTRNPSDADTVSASFPNLPLAVLIGRRLQWALQGFAVAGTVIVRAGEEGLDGSMPLASAATGQILLSPQAAGSVSNLPGLTLQGFDRRENGNGWHELLWQSPSQADSFAEDEQSLLGLIRDCGREDPCPPEPAWGAFGSVPPGASKTTSVPEPAPADRTWLGKRRWLLVGGIGIALVLVIGIIALAAHRGTAPAQATSKPAEQSPSRAVSTDSPLASSDSHVASSDSHALSDSHGASSGPAAAKVASVAMSKPVPLPPSDIHAAHSRAPKEATDEVKQALPVESHPKKPAETQACEFSEAGISRALTRAETDMHDGRLEEAKAAFLTIRGCASAHQRVEEDLRIVQLKISAQGLTEPNP